MKNIVIILVLAFVLVMAIRYIVKAKKNGVKCIGCPSGKECGGCNCGCSDADSILGS